MKEISVQTFKEVLDTARSDNNADFINICTPAEYKEGHITGVRSVPLDTLIDHIDEFKNKKTIYVHCRSGKRAATAIKTLAANGITAELINVSGGLMAWEDAKYAINSHTARLPIMRQVFLVAGVLVLGFSIAALTIDTSFAFGTIFVGIGLTLSGATGWCGMALALSKMPWNK